MKRIIYALLPLIVFGFSSCVYEEKEIFSESAAIRLNESLENAEKTLIAAENGWVMQYFPTEESAGYTLLVKFDKNGLAEIAGQNKYFPAYTTDTGSYDVIGDNGPVLTFNTYNKVLHIFSDPKDPAGTDKLDGLGLQGDYEFVIIEATPDKIVMKGKKRGTNIIMTKLNNDVIWKDYMVSLDEMDKFLFNVKVPTLSLTVGSDVLIASNGSSHIFSLVPLGGNEILDGFEAPFIVTGNGIYLYEPLKIGEVSVQNFKMKDDKSGLVAVENGSTYITGPELVQFINDSITWTANNYRIFNADKAGGEFAALYANVVSGCKSAYKEDFGSFSFRYIGSMKGRSLHFESGKYNGNVKVDIEVDNATRKVVFKQGEDSDKNWKTYSKKIPAFADFLDALCSRTFTLTTNSPMCPINMVLTDDSNPDNYFTLTMND